SAPVPLLPILFAFRHWPRAYVLVQHAPPVVAAGEPLDAASPGDGHVSQPPEAPSPPHAITVATGVPERRARASIRQVRGVWINRPKNFYRNQTKSRDWRKFLSTPTLSMIQKNASRTCDGAGGVFYPWLSLKLPWT